MKPSLTLPLLWLLLPAVLQAQGQRFEPVSNTGRWYKGNTHSHTINTDGDSPPDTVVKWYKTHGYNFLVVSDHDTITEPGMLSQFVDTAFVLVRGEEVTGHFERVPVHLTALNPGSIIKPRSAANVAATLQANIDAIRAAGGVPLINHPNYRWALDQRTLAGSRNVSLFELFNGHPHVHNDGGGESPSTEALWDALLSSGRRIYGVASDDSHHWRRWSREDVNPGKGWIYVRATRLDPVDLVRAIESGRFYSSTGVELEDYVVNENTIAIRIKQDRDFKYTTEFIGDGGRVLARDHGPQPRYTLQPGVNYVRARIIDSGGRTAWTQPVFVK